MSEQKKKAFMVYHKDGVDDWVSDDEIQYLWATTSSGVLLVTKKEFHTTFSAMTREDLVYAYSPKAWDKVEVVDEDIEVVDAAFNGSDPF